MGGCLLHALKDVPFEIQGRFRWCVINEEHLLLKGNGDVSNKSTHAQKICRHLTKPTFYLH